MRMLYLDDERKTPPGWECAKTAQDAILLLQEGTFTHVSLDHDLGPSEAGTGYDVACWIEEQAMNGTLPKLVCFVHSANPVGRQRMKSALVNAVRYWNENSST